MNDDVLILRVAARFLRADQPPGMRKEVKDLVKPVNPPRGIDRGILKEHGERMEDGNDESINPNHRDIQPKDVFIPKPNQTSVRNLAETGEDLQNAINNKIPKDRGYDTVKNLSQFLIETGGGGGTKPVK